uniref:Integrase zinc-binding domain-containing protein n=1 Tax=Ananas comosus var. bracteatus TaxID=296719 RepID=A0A6V7NH35_ANACO|nr:unnamed protein product [Ananas comosus var. bracteatus]
MWRVRGVTTQLLTLIAQPTSADRISLGQQSDSHLQKIQAEVEQGRVGDFKVHSNGSLRFWDRRYVPKDPDLRRDILSKAHRSPYTMYPGGTKMYRDLKQHFWWPGMKLDIAQHVAQCLVCQQVKAEHQ